MREKIKVKRPPPAVVQEPVVLKSPRKARVSPLKRLSTANFSSQFSSGVS